MIVHTVNNSGMTPLHIAYKEMQLDVAKFLVFERKCLLNLGDESLIDINSNLYIHLACQNEGDINLILKVLAYAYKNLLAINFLIESDCSLDTHGMYPIHLPCSKSLTCVLLSQRLNTNDINICDK